MNEERLRNITDTPVQRCRPKRIISIGSYGRPTDAGDADLRMAEQRQAPFRKRWARGSELESPAQRDAP